MSSETMRAILVKDGKGPVENLYFGEAPTPKIEADNDVLVKIKAFGLNRMDILQREGQYPLPPGAPTIMGVEFSGEVLSAGQSAQSTFQKGQPVFGLALGGAYAQVIKVQSSLLLHKPDKLSWEQAAAIPEQWLTAFQALRPLANLQPKESVLIHAGASGVGLAAAQLAKDFGAAKVYVTAGSEDKCKMCESIAADRAFNYKAQDWAEELSKATNGEGVDVIMDFIGADYWNNNINSLKRDGRLIMQGAMGGVKVKDGALVGPIIFKRLRIIGSTLRSRTVEYQGQLVQDFLKEGGLDKIVSGCNKDGKSDPNVRTHHLVIHKVYSWKDIKEAHKEMQANANTGKIIVVIDD